MGTSSEGPSFERRPPVSNADWDARRMLRLAEAGAYPSAAKWSKDREAEIAYWKQRCGLPVDLPPADESDGAGDHDRAANAAFLELEPASQRTILFCYLTSPTASSQARGAFLCGLLGYDLAAVRAAAHAEMEARADAMLARLRAQASVRKRPRQPAQGGPELFDQEAA